MTLEVIMGNVVPIDAQISCCIRLWKVKDKPLNNMIALIMLIGSIVAIFLVIQPEYYNQLIQHCVAPISVACMVLALMHVTSCLLFSRIDKPFPRPVNRSIRTFVKIDLPIESHSIGIQTTPEEPTPIRVSYSNPINAITTTPKRGVSALIPPSPHTPSLSPRAIASIDAMDRVSVQSQPNEGIPSTDAASDPSLETWDVVSRPGGKLTPPDKTKNLDSA